VGLNPSAGASMANDEHVAILKKGVDAWNEWRRRENESLWPDLSGADLTEADLRGANLTDARLFLADLHGADLTEADLRGADLHEAKLTEANLTGADLNGAYLNGADLRDAYLIWADLTTADLHGADLRGADLTWANLHAAKLTGANLTGAHLRGTVFGFTTLTKMKGLDHCHHQGPCVIDFQTLKNSSPLPIAFLRGVGLPDNLIENLPSLLNTAIQHYSCFISYSSKDQAFAERLYADLQSRGVRCWFAPDHMRIGDKIVDAIDEAIRLRDKVLLILSEGAIASDWVEDEVTTAFEEERKRKDVIVFPVRIDNAVMQAQEAWAAKLRNRHIGDFCRWKEHDSYQESFERLMHDLRVEKPGQ
jgi:TIR domain/Pentapeptide repeats (8 copies)